MYLNNETFTTHFLKIVAIRYNSRNKKDKQLYLRYRIAKIK